MRLFIFKRCLVIDYTSKLRSPFHNTYRLTDKTLVIVMFGYHAYFSYLFLFRFYILTLPIWMISLLIGNKVIYFHALFSDWLHKEATKPISQ